MPRTTDANLGCAFAESTFYTLIIGWKKSQQNRIEFLTRPASSPRPQSQGCGLQPLPFSKNLSSILIYCLGLTFRILGSSEVLFNHLTMAYRMMVQQESGNF